MVAAARDTPARRIRILPAVRRVVGIGLEQAARPLGLVARKVEHALGRRPFRMVAHRIGLAATAPEDCVLGCWRCLAPGIGSTLLAASGRFPLGLGRQAGAPPGAEGHRTLPGAFGRGVARKAGLGREAAVRDADTCVSVVHLDERPVIAARAAPQAVGVRSLDVIGRSSPARTSRLAVTSSVLRKAANWALVTS